MDLFINGHNLDLFINGHNVCPNTLTYNIHTRVATSFQGGPTPWTKMQEHLLGWDGRLPPFPIVQVHLLFEDRP